MKTGSHSITQRFARLRLGFCWDCWNRFWGLLLNSGLFLWIGHVGLEWCFICARVSSQPSHPHHTLVTVRYHKHQVEAPAETVPACVQLHHSRGWWIILDERVHSCDKMNMLTLLTRYKKKKLSFSLHCTNNIHYLHHSWLHLGLSGFSVLTWCCSHQWSTSLRNMVLASAWSCIIALYSTAGTAPLFEGHQQVWLPVGKPVMKLFLDNTPLCVWFFSLRGRSDQSSARSNRNPPVCTVSDRCAAGNQ